MNPLKYLIRDATADDAAAVARLVIDTKMITYEPLIPLEHKAAFMRGVGTPASQAEVWRSRIEQQGTSGRSNVRVLEEDGEIGGLYRVLRNQAGVFITNFYVSGDHQGKGLGRALMNDIRSQAPGEPLALEVLVNNTSAIGFYEKMGFHVIPGSTHTFYGVQKILMKDLVTD